MGIAREHELHRRRLGRNTGVGLALGAIVVILLGLTVAKVEIMDTAGPYSSGAASEGADR